MICEVVRPDFTKSSVFSLLSTATAIMVNKNMQKKKVTKSFLSMYQSIFFMNESKVKEKLLRSCESRCYNLAFSLGIISLFQLAKSPPAICCLACVTSQI